MPSNNVLVTGFGPFGEHKINASWEAVQLLPNYKIDDVNIIVKEIPVLYTYVDEQIPELWKTYNPKLVVHVGVSSYTNKLTIETQAFRMGYERTDCENNKHPTGTICSSQSGEDCIKTFIDANKICDTVNGKENVEACVSTNAGRYLCEYTYYRSLNIDSARTVFVHVPPLNNPYSAEQLADGLIAIIRSALEQLCSGA